MPPIARPFPRALVRSLPAALAALTALLPLTRAHAQRAGALEVGALGRFSIFDQNLGIENSIAGGGRIGFFILRNLSVEGEVTYGVADVKSPIDTLDQVSDEIFSGRLLYHQPIGGAARLLVGGGYTYDAYGMARRGPARGGGPAGLLGLSIDVGPRVTLRMEGTAHYVPSSSSTSPVRLASTNFGAQAGLSIGFFRTRGATVVQTRVDTVVRTVERTRTLVDTVYRDRINERTSTSIAPGGTVVIGVVNFAFGSAELTTDARRILTDIASSLARPENAQLKVRLVGNTDAVGGEQANVRLSERRADNVADFLRGSGVGEARILTEAAGKSNPIARNDTPEGRATNRRVIILLAR